MGISIKIAGICATPEERERGLQNIELSDDECMVFLFESSKIAKFWGRGTMQDLKVSFVSDGIVSECSEIRMMDESPVSSSAPCDMAVESVEGIPVGSRLSFSKGYLRADDND